MRGVQSGGPVDFHLSPIGVPSAGGEASGRADLAPEGMMGTAGSRFGSAARLSLGLALVAFFPLDVPAYAAFPGANGKIAFEDAGATTLYSVNPDGSGLAQLGTGSYPRWRPDGRKIAFRNGGAFLMNPD